MRFLLLSDTHGKRGIINDLAADVRADAVIHAGDFGFYDEGSYERLSDRELRLHITHSDLDTESQKGILGLPRAERIAASKKACPLTELPAYIEKKRRFELPVYAVWGNHEDKVMVERFFHSELEVENLHVLSNHMAFRVGPAFVYGLGGNHLPGPKMLQRPIAGGSGRVWNTLSQYAELIEAADEPAGHPGIRIFVSHVSPGKEPFIELLAARTRAEFTVSGHMGAPYPMVWNPFAVRTVEEAMDRLQHGNQETKRSCLEAAGSEPAWVTQVFNLIERIPEEEVRLGRGAKVPRWYSRKTHINLPDANVGYAVLDLTEEGPAVRTVAG